MEEVLGRGRKRERSLALRVGKSTIRSRVYASSSRTSYEEFPVRSTMTKLFDFGVHLNRLELDNDAKTSAVLSR